MEAIYKYFASEKSLIDNMTYMSSLVQVRSNMNTQLSESPINAVRILLGGQDLHMLNLIFLVGNMDNQSIGELKTLFGLGQSSKFSDILHQLKYKFITQMYPGGYSLSDWTTFNNWISDSAKTYKDSIALKLLTAEE